MSSAASIMPLTGRLRQHAAPIQAPREGACCCEEHSSTRLSASARSVSANLTRSLSANFALEGAIWPKVATGKERREAESGPSPGRFLISSSANRGRDSDHDGAQAGPPMWQIGHPRPAPVPRASLATGLGDVDGHGPRAKIEMDH